MLQWLVVFSCAAPAWGQVSGNAVLERQQRGGYSNGASATSLSDKLFLTDSTFVLGANVMQHVRADRYVAVFGLRESAPSVAAADKHLTARVSRFIGRLRRLDVEAKSVYTDLITQTRIEDVRASRQSGFTHEQYLRGFELTRNVIVPFRRIEVLNEMLVAAAADSVYDLVKVEYIVSDPEAVYASLFKAATEVLARKRANYLQLTGAQLRPAAQPYAERYAAFQPVGQYQSYTATVSTFFDSNQYTQLKQLPQLVTYYYSPPSADGFDRVINPVVVEPAVTYTLAVQVKYTLRK
jgi:uncharacterized protein YggE